MELQRFEIRGLFGTYHHIVDFPSTSGNKQMPSVVIIHGRNGIGKTTLLRMLDGILRLDFNPFRRVPFNEAVLKFSNKKSITVQAEMQKGKLRSLTIKYGKNTTCLHPHRSGPLSDDYDQSTEKFRTEFFEETSQIAFEYIDIERLTRIKNAKGSESQPNTVPEFVLSPTGQVISTKSNTKAKRIRDLTITLDKRVAEFIKSAQVNYREFFSSTEPDLFPKILERLGDTEISNINEENLKAIFKSIRDQDRKTERLGLESDKWDYKQILDKIEKIDDNHETKQYALTVLSVYAEHLSSRAQERKLVADRLLVFEDLLSNFLVGKKVTLDSLNGMEIRTESGDNLTEMELSSGEYHLLYLMVSSLVTKQKGTILAIDEPEMSMHIAWQRRLIPALIECASGAEPLFIFATHSPDLAAPYANSMIDLG